MIAAMKATLAILVTGVLVLASMAVINEFKNLISGRVYTEPAALGWVAVITAALGLAGVFISAVIGMTGHLRQR